MSRHKPFLFLTEDERELNKLSEESFHHLVNVLRLKAGDLFTGLDNSGYKLECSLGEISKKSASYDIIDRLKFEKPLFTMILAQALTKLETFEEIIDKAVQLGVSGILPLITKNTTVSEDLFKKKFSRLNKILKTAAEQSQRIFLPVLENPVSLKQFAETHNPEKTIFAYEKANLPMKKLLEHYSENSLTYACGPEGGFTEAEINLLITKGFPLVSLGKNILRAETAVITGLGNIIYELGDRF